jgi:hypothetical protein
MSLKIEKIKLKLIKLITLTEFSHEFDNNKQILTALFWPNWPGLCKTDNIIRMITLTAITLSGGHCIMLRNVNSLH